VVDLSKRWIPHEFLQRDFGAHVMVQRYDPIDWMADNSEIGPGPEQVPMNPIPEMPNVNFQVRAREDATNKGLERQVARFEKPTAREPGDPFVDHFFVDFDATVISKIPEDDVFQRGTATLGKMKAKEHAIIGCHYTPFHSEGARRLPPCPC